MSPSPHMRRRGATYHFRRKLPLYISARIGSREIVRSLQTGHYQVARTRARSLSVICDHIFEAVQRMPNLTKSEIDKILDQWFESH